MVKRATLLLVGSLAAVTLLSACPEKPKDRKQTIDRFIPTGRTALDLELEFPVGGGFTSTCSGAGSYLVSIDTNGAGAWQYQLLFDATRTLLYGCGTPADDCPPGTGLSAELPSISRFMIEGLSVTPQAYETSSGAIDIVCRGIADEGVLPGSVTFVAAAPTPTPGPTQSYADIGTFTVRVKMLEVGASNPLPIGTGIVPTQRRFGAAASLSVPEHSIGIGAGGPRGHIAIAGGVESASDMLPNEIWEFDPQSLAFSISPATLTAGSNGLAGLTATTYLGPGGAPAILFAGGSATSTVQSTSALAWQEASSFRFPPMPVGRSLHSAGYLKRSGVDPVIALVGGVNFDPATEAIGAAGQLADFVYFVPPDSEIPAPCTNAISTNGYFCDPSSSVMTAARGFSAAVPFYEGGVPKLWIAGGAQAGSSRSETDALDGSANGIVDGNTAAAASCGGAAAVVTSSGMVQLDGFPLVFGGLLDPDAANARDAVFIRKDVATTTLLTATMRFQRGGLSAVVLRDQTVLLIGGRDDGAAVNGIAPLELFVPNLNPVTLGEFRFAATPGGTCDTTGVAPAGCPTLVTPRWGQTATRLDETQTWLDGAVLIAGGGATGESGAELFVPAYLCQGDTPIGPLAMNPAVPHSNATLPPLCDLNRLAVPITNPTAP